MTESERFSMALNDEIAFANNARAAFGAHELTDAFGGQIHDDLARAWVRRENNVLTISAALFELGS